jgi:hypothetical protein
VFSEQNKFNESVKYFAAIGENFAVWQFKKVVKPFFFINYGDLSNYSLGMVIAPYFFRSGKLKNIYP